MSSKPKKNPSNWYEHAACLGYETDLWFPDAPQGRDYFALARQVCKTCEVKQECLDFALSFTSENDRFGMFGGLSPKQRMMIRDKQVTYQAPPKPVEMPVRRTVYKQPHVYTYAFHAKDVIHPQAFEIKKRSILQSGFTYEKRANRIETFARKVLEFLKIIRIFVSYGKIRREQTKR